VRKYDAEYQASIASVPRAERRSPAPPSHAVTVFLLPLLGGPSAFLFCLLACVGLTMPLKKALQTSAVVTGIVGGLTLAWWMRNVQNYLYIQEIIGGVDVNNDGYIGPPPKQLLDLQFRDRHGTMVRLGDLELEPRQLQLFARAVLAGKSLARRNWDRFFIGPTGESLYPRIYDWLLLTGLAVRKSTSATHGIVLTERGWRFIRTLADTDVRELPEIVDVQPVGLLTGTPHQAVEEERAEG